MCSDTNCWGIPTPPCADRGCSDFCSTEGKAHWHNILRGLAKLPTSTGESILLEIDRERVTTHMEEEAHFTQTQLPLLSHTTVQGSRAAALGSYSLFLSSRISLLFSTTLSFALTKSCLFYRHPRHLFNNGCTWIDTFVNDGCNYHWQMVTLLLRVGCPIMAIS